LPVTTLRTIDLEGKKNSDLLFSRFCGEREIFSNENTAPQLVQIGWRPSPEKEKREDGQLPVFLKAEADG
jgi:hypothetical protein